jgi:hypothetical protein
MCAAPGIGGLAIGTSDVVFVLTTLFVSEVGICAWSTRAAAEPARTASTRMVLEGMAAALHGGQGNKGNKAVHVRQQTRWRGSRGVAEVGGSSFVCLKRLATIRRAAVVRRGRGGGALREEGGAHLT